MTKVAYCTRCYTRDSNKLHPFGFCNDCWIKAGTPKGMTK